jgi:hypothetical protein
MLLKALMHLYNPDVSDMLQTICSEYLELVFIHHGAFTIWPSVHRGCLAGFSMLAHMMELHIWCTNRDTNTKAIAAFHHKVWMVAAWMGSVSCSPHFLH